MVLEPVAVVLWRDDDLLVVDKPAGLSTLVDGWHPDSPYLLSVLKPVFDPLWVVHRLDKETSGVIVFARTAAAHRLLNLQFDHRQIEKIYHALVWGEPTWDQKQVRLPLRPNADRRHRTLVDPKNGKSALTELLVLERFPGCALLQATPHTGRTHQVRAHLSALRLPIVGDRLYGGQELAGLDRVALHAFSISLVHPTTQAEMKFTAQHPDEFRQALDRLRIRPGQ